MNVLEKFLSKEKGVNKEFKKVVILKLSEKENYNEKKSLNKGLKK